MSTEKNRTVEIPESLFNRVSALVQGTQFKTVSEYVTHIIREQVAKEESRNSSGYSKEEEEKIKSRLKALGYLE